MIFKQVSLKSSIVIWKIQQEMEHTDIVVV